MHQRTFVRRRAAGWERLDQLLARATKRGLGSLSAHELFEMGRLHRSASSDLAYARARGYEMVLLQYLNRLVVRSHAFVYGSAGEAGRDRIVRFFAQTFPREVRASALYIGTCAALTIVWACAAYGIVMHNPADASALLPQWLVPDHITKSLHDSNFAFSSQRAAEMSSFIITNNIRVAILTFAAGIVTLGAFTIYLIVFNALMLGALGAAYTQAGFGPDFWATIAPHGFIELTSIQIAGGAGLVMAAGVLFPGRLTRRESIARSGARAGALIGGVCALLCVAGIIEGFFSPLRFTMHVREGFGCATAVLLVLYLTLCGRTTTTRAVLSADTDR